LPAVGGVLGSLGSADGKGVVRMEDRFDTGIDDVWAAVADPARLARWLGEVEGDLRPGGEFRAHFTASDWKGAGRIEVCEPPCRLLVLTRDEDEPGSAFEHSIELTLTADGGRTVVVWEERGMPVDLLAPYGAGIQIHVEDLGAYLAGSERVDARARWAELEPAYRELAPQP
jgi:uncharacterized protein YndB with AHSA1/START domain